MDFKELKEKKERQDLWEFFVNEKYEEARKEVEIEMLNRVNQKWWKIMFKGREQREKISKKLNSWFEKIEKDAEQSKSAQEQKQ